MTDTPTTTDPDELRLRRLIALEGAHNVRDLGGYRAADGRTVRWGLVFRADSMDECSDADHELLAALGIRVVCDLRGPGEGVESAPRFLGDGLYQRFHLDGDVAAADEYLERILAGEIKVIEVDWMIKVYGWLVKLYGERFGEVLRLIADGELPLLFHCMAGKDRTGMTAAFLLHALGVPEDVIFDDYVLTEVYRENWRERLTTRLAKVGVDYADVQAFFGADRRVIAGAFADLERRHGSIEAFLTNVGVGPDVVARLRERLLEDAPAV
jgi:protein-tyrosine phosphatase